MSKNLIIVAHPDDEILFGYSKLREGNWHVLSITGGNRETRHELHSVCERLNLTYDIFIHCDDWGAVFDYNEIVPEIKQVLSAGYNQVLTHNLNGEYGHTQHQSLSEIVQSLVSSNLFEFGHPGPILPFNILKEKLDVLSMYEIHGKLGVWDWYDQNDADNTMMKYVVCEGFRQVK